MERSEYRDLINHMEWADARTWMCVLNLPSLEDDEWIKEHLHHYHSTQWAYGQILLRRPIVIPELSSFPDLRSVGLWARRFYRELSGRLIGLDETELHRNVEFPWAAQIAKRPRGTSPATAGQSIIQLALHSTHHRGQVVMRVRQAGGEPSVTDFIAWLWMGCPAPEWGVLSSG
jgi:hypothetical protein